MTSTSKKPRILDAVLRVSRVNGRDDDGGTFMSPDEQRDTIQAWANDHDVTIAEWVDETDSVSGSTTEREGLQEALARALRGDTDGIVVAKVDRFARTLTGGLAAVGQLDRAGKHFVAVKDGINGDHGSSATGRMLRGILFLFANWQLDSLTESWDATRKRHIANGVHTTIPYGYRRQDGDDAKGAGRVLVPEPVEKDAVVMMFSRRADGESWPAIATWLNDKGVKPRQAAGWTHGRIKSIVESRVYLGEITSGEYVNTAAHEPIVSHDLWLRANGRRATAKRRNAGDFLLRGLVRCSACGVRMVGSSYTRNGTTYRYYKCRKSHPFGPCPSPAQIRADRLEAAIEERFAAEFLDRDYAGVATTDALDAAETALAEAEADLTYFLTSPSTDELRRSLGDAWVEEGQSVRVARVVEARQAVADARAVAFGITLPTDLAELWPTMNVEDRRTVLAEVFEVIAVAKGGEWQEWTRDDPDAPRGLPAAGDFTAARPIKVA